VVNYLASLMKEIYGDSFGTPVQGHGVRSFISNKLSEISGSIVSPTRKDNNA